jgi:hypothetical protein
MRVLAALLVVVFGAGCMNRVVIPQSELSKLDGFSDSQRTSRHFELKTTEGQTVDFAANPTLTLLTAGERATWRFREIFVSKTTFDAVVVGAPPLALDLTTITAAETEVPATGKSLALAAGLIAGVGVLAFLTIIAVFISSVRY